MIDGGVISGYLALAVARGVDRFVSSRIDAILAALASRIRSKMGPKPIHELRFDPGDPQIQDKIAQAIERRAGQDARFAQDLARLTDRLDREGGRPLLHQVWHGGSVHVGHGNAVQVQQNNGSVAGRDINNLHMRHPGEIYDKPVLVKAGYCVSALAFVGGFGLIGYSFFEIFSTGADLEKGPDWIVHHTYVVQGAVCLFAALVFAMLSSVGASMSRPRR